MRKNASFFSSFFDHFFVKNQRKKPCVFSHRRLFFSTWRPSRNTIFYNTKATFSFFAFLCFFLKKRQKTCSKIETTFFLSKITKKSSPGTHFGTQNATELTSKRSKNPNFAKKSTFWSEQFFQRFLECQKAIRHDSARRRRRGVQKLTIPRSNGWHVRSRVVLLGKPSICLRKVRLGRQTNDLWALAPAKWPDRMNCGTTVTTLRGV